MSAATVPDSSRKICAMSIGTVPQSMWEIDLRSLASLRIGLALLILNDLFRRAFDISTFYSDAGVLPRTALIDHFLASWQISVHLVSGEAGVQDFLFAIAGVFAVMLLVGFRTRLAATVSWFMLISLQARNPSILDSGDVLLRMLLFWGMFLPLGARWSFDAIAQLRSNHRTFTSAATAALLVQVASVYFFTALQKSHPIWWQGKAISYALRIDQFATPFGSRLLTHPQLMKALTWGTLFMEFVGPIVVFCPMIAWRIRIAVVPMFWCLHLGMALCLELGAFPLICATAWLVFLPAPFWDAIQRRYAGLARTALDKMRRLSLSRWLVLHTYRFHYPPIERHRPLRTNVINNAIALFFLAYVTLWNVRSLDAEDLGMLIPNRTTFIADLFRVDQNWAMFAPFPMKDHGWYVIPARLADGTNVDLLTARAVSWDKPHTVSATFANSRWRKYLVNLWEAGDSRSASCYRDWHIRQWNTTHAGDKRIEKAELCFMRSVSNDAGSTSPEKVVLWAYSARPLNDRK